MKNKYLENVKRIVIKVGTSTLTHENSKLNYPKISQLVGEIAQLHKQGYEIIFVSSGAVGCGNGKLGITKNTNLSQKQASAAVGQVLLMKLYEELFEKHNIAIGQILLTKDDVTNRKNNLNARNTINELLNMNVIPIINENDSTVIDEIKVGDNDNLSALVAILADASLLVLLSDIAGIYTDNPQKNKNAQFLDIIEKVDDTVMSYAKDKGSEFAVGGMQTKLEAAKKVNTAGIMMIIANGSTTNILLDIVSGEFKGSLFLASEESMVAKKKWLLLSSNDKGSIIVDDGAASALLDGANSLLPIGVIKVNKNFDAGDVVNIYSNNNELLAKGISNYSSYDINVIKGLKKAKFSEHLSLENLHKTVVHRDNLALIKENL